MIFRGVKSASCNVFQIFQVPDLYNELQTMKGKKNISVTIKENKASDAKREKVCIYNYCKYICKLHNSMKVCIYSYCKYIYKLHNSVIDLYCVYLLIVNFSIGLYLTIVT